MKNAIIKPSRKSVEVQLDKVIDNLSFLLERRFKDPSPDLEKRIHLLYAELVELSRVKGILDYFERALEEENTPNL